MRSQKDDRGMSVERHQKVYEQFYEVKRTSKRGLSIAYKKIAIRELLKYIGCFALITNEKIFGNIKELLNIPRMLFF